MAAPRRATLARELVRLVGPAATLVDVGDGWPSLIDIRLSNGRKTRIAAHLGNITDMARTGAQPIATRPRETRFQNPGSSKPVSTVPGATTMLIGMLPSIDGDPPAIVIPGNNRQQPQPARVSVRFPGSLAYSGARTGWASYTSSDGELMHGLIPALLPTLIEALRLGVTLPRDSMATAAQAAGALNGDDDAKERARVATTRIVRDAKFRKDVLKAHGHACALCGLSEGQLLHAAHLMPAKLPGSKDEVSNGVPACLHHHAALDAHLVHIDPSSLAISVQPALASRAVSDPGLGAFLATTRSHLPLPPAIDRRAVKAWLGKRYAAYPMHYEWV